MASPDTIIYIAQPLGEGEDPGAPLRIRPWCIAMFLQIYGQLLMLLALLQSSSLCV